MSIQISDQALFKTQAYINGQWIDADSGATLPVTNPANGEVIAEVAKCSSEKCILWPLRFGRKPKGITYKKLSSKE